MPPISKKGQEILEQFNGRWALDLKRSDPISPMLEALKTPYLIRKMAVSMHVEQTIKVTNDELEICNHVVIGSSSVVHTINGGAVELTDEKGEKTLDETSFNEDAEYPIVINAVLPRDKGYTKDSRRIVDNDEMQQILEYRLRKDDPPMVMRRYWNKMGSVYVRIPTNNSSSKPEVSLKRVPQAVAEPEAPSSSLPLRETDETPPKLVTTSEATSSSTSAIPPTREATLRKEDWSMIALLLVFFTSAWYRSSYVEACLWGAIAALFRTSVVFPKAVDGHSVDWWTLPNATFAATAAAMVYASRVILNPLENDGTTMALESLTAVGAYCWTRRADLIALDLNKVFENSKTLTKSRSWAELALLTIVLVAVCSDETEGLPLNKALFAAILYGIARYRAQIASLNKTQTSVVQVETSVVVPRSSHPTPSTGNNQAAHHHHKRPKNTSSHPTVRFVASRVAKYSKKPFAEYMAEIDLGSDKGTFSVWSRYRDLYACHDAIQRAYQSNGWEGLPRFPPKQWDSTSDQVVAERQTELDSYFSRVFSDHGADVAKIDQVASVFHLDESRTKILLEVHEATRRLFQAKRICETVVSEGEDSKNGWALLSAGKREYCKIGLDGDKTFKRIAVTLESPQDVMKRVLNNRPDWDLNFISQSLVRKISLTTDDEKSALSDMRLVMEQTFVPVKHIRRTRTSFLGPKLRDLVVFQAAATDPSTGRMIFVETSVGRRIELDVFPQAEGHVREHVTVNGFVIEPFAGGRTKITSIRKEDSATEGFPVVF